MRPAETPAEPPFSGRRSPRTPDSRRPLLRRLAARVAVRLSTVALRLGRWATVRDRTVHPDHPSVWQPQLATVADRGEVRGPALTLVRGNGHGASEGDPDL